VYQDVNGSRREVASSFVLLDDPSSESTATHHSPVATHQIGFAVGSYDLSRPLVIDPVLSYSTYLGGSARGQGYGIAVDPAGNAYVTGYTYSHNFPTANAFQPHNGGNGSNAFVTKFSADGTSLVYSSYLGGASGDFGYGIAVDADGNAYLTGQTRSTDFPTANAFQPAKGGPAYTTNAFVTKVSVDGSGLVYSSYLGGNGDGYPSYNGDYGLGIAMDGDGSVYITGYAASTDFPTVNAFQPTKRGVSTNAFVTKFSADGSSLVYSTYLGGSGYYDEEHGIDYGDVGMGIAVDAAGNAYLTGQTYSFDFPIAHAFQPTKGGNPIYAISNAFVTKLSPDGSSLVYSSYLGGGGYSTNYFGYGDDGDAIAVDGAGNAYVTGFAYSTDFPTANAFQPTKGGSLTNPNAFVTKVSPDGDGLVYSSYLGGSGKDVYGYGDHGYGIALDGAGNAYLTGSTTSTDFPTVNAFQPTNGSYYTAFVAKIAD
jgi:hypothetical protein